MAEYWMIETRVIDPRAVELFDAYNFICKRCGGECNSHRFTLIECNTYRSIIVCQKCISEYRTVRNIHFGWIVDGEATTVYDIHTACVFRRDLFPYGQWRSTKI